MKPYRAKAYLRWISYGTTGTPSLGAASGAARGPPRGYGVVNDPPRIPDCIAKQKQGAATAESSTVVPAPTGSSGERVGSSSPGRSLLAIAT